MDDLSQKLAGILNDPESMERVRKMAENIFMENEENPSNKGACEGGNMPLGEDFSKIIAMVSKFNSQKDDERTVLLNALKPYLSEKRQEKTENAIKILKLLELLPLIKESGLFKF